MALDWIFEKARKKILPFFFFPSLLVVLSSAQILLFDPHYSGQVLEVNVVAN